MASGPSANALGHRDVGGLQTLRAFRYFKFHGRAFIKATVPLGLKGRKVDEDILSILPLNKAVALGGVKPLHCTFFFHLPIPSSLKMHFPETRRTLAAARPETR